MFLITAIVALTALIFASAADLKKREVPDWLNYALIAIGLSSGAIASLVFWTWTFAAYSLAGFLIFLVIAYLMFYAGQWGGGDSKMIMGLGALIGFEFSFSYPFMLSENFLIAFWVNTLLAGVVYALFWSIFLAFKHTRKVGKRFSEEIGKSAFSRNLVLAVTLIIAAISFIPNQPEQRTVIYLLAVISFASFYLMVLVRSVEKACMYKLLTPEQLTEGDWIAKEVRVGGKYLCGPKDLGIEKKQISKLMKLKQKGKIKRVLVKEGIPFVPSFLLGFIITLLWGNVLFAWL